MSELIDILEQLEAEKPAPVVQGSEEVYRAKYGHVVGELVGEKPRFYPHRWENSPGPAQLEAEGTVLHGQQPPELYIQKESPAHRLMLILRARAHTQREIAELTGYNEAYVSQVLRQPWAVKQITEFQNEAGLNPLKEKIAELGKTALFTLEDVMTAPETPANVRSTTAQYLVNRFLGKPKESLVINDNRNADQLTDAELVKIATAKN